MDLFNNFNTFACSLTRHIKLYKIEKPKVLNKKIKVSVVIPVFNSEPYIKKAFHSVKNQQWVDEVIFVNDFSHDNSVTILKEILTNNYEYVKVINNNKNYGAGESRNIGIKAAKNDWIAFLDADDYYYNNRFSNAVKIIAKYKDADGVYEAVENIFENNNAKKTFIDSRPDKNNFLYTMEEKIPPEKLFKILMEGNKGFFHLNGVLIKKIAFEKIGYFNKDLELSQDTDALFKIAMTENLYPGLIEKPVAARLVHDNNRMFLDNNKLNFYRAKKYYSFRNHALKNKLEKSVLKIIEEKNIKLCALDILDWNIYKFYRIKYFILKLIYPIILTSYIKKNSKKYISKNR